MKPSHPGPGKVADDDMKAKLRSLALLLAAGCAPALAAGQDQPPGYIGVEQRLTPAQLRQIGLTPAQIELLDRYLQASEVTAPAAAARGGTPGDGMPGDGSGVSFLGLDQGPIRSRLKGRVAGWEPGTVFALENGQRWQVLKGRMTLRAPVDAPDILILPGIAGRWFLQVDEDLPKARVHRVE